MVVVVVVGGEKAKGTRVGLDPFYAMTDDQEKCRLAEIVQFDCQAEPDEKVHCYPIPRIFRMQVSSVSLNYRVSDAVPVVKDMQKS